MDHPSRVTCPRCEADVTVGLPRGSTVLEITNDPDEALDAEIESDARRKRRPLECPSGHRFYVYFEF